MRSTRARRGVGRGVGMEEVMVSGRECTGDTELQLRPATWSNVCTVRMCASMYGVRVCTN
jgi:hypothetical protein